MGGQVHDGAALGSNEYGAAVLGVPLILVLGHENCGAVSATIMALAYNAEADGSMAALIEGIIPAVEQVKDQPGDLLDNAVRANIALGVEHLHESPILAELIGARKLKISGGRHF